MQLDLGSTLQYNGVGEDSWHRLSTSAAAWGFYRDNIEEQFAAVRVLGKVATGANILDDLFGNP